MTVSLNSTEQAEPPRALSLFHTFSARGRRTRLDV